MSISSAGCSAAFKIDSRYIFLIPITIVNHVVHPRVSNKSIRMPDPIRFLQAGERLDLAFAVIPVTQRRNVVNGRCCISCANTSLPWFIDRPREVVLRRVTEPAFAVQIETKTIHCFCVFDQQLTDSPISNVGTLLVTGIKSSNDPSSTHYSSCSFDIS